LTDWPTPKSLFGSDFFNGDFDLLPSRLGITIPSINVTETPAAYLLEVAAPGLERKDFNIEVENSCLCISAEKKEEKKEKEGDYTRKEFSFNSFSRTFNLPEDVKDGSIDARYENGVLKITVPKAKEAPAKATRKIAIS
jgi:HSP20 family protein